MCVFTQSYTHSSQLLLSFVFLFLFTSWVLPTLSPLGRLCDPQKEAENPDFIRLLGQSLTIDLAIMYAVAILLVNCTIGCAQQKHSPIWSTPVFGMLLACIGQQFNPGYLPA